MNDLKELAINKLKDRGVSINDMALIAYETQKKYDPSLTVEHCAEVIDSVLAKREVIHAVLTGIAIDSCVEKGIFDKEISEIIHEDKGLYGVDEILALSIVNVYGSIALTNFGYLDKLKPGIIGVVDKDKDSCNTFLDDIVGAITAAAISKIAHTS